MSLRENKSGGQLNRTGNRIMYLPRGIVAMGSLTAY